jgi:hypothetical protein
VAYTLLRRCRVWIWCERQQQQQQQQQSAKWINKLGIEVELRNCLKHTAAQQAPSFARRDAWMISATASREQQPRMGQEAQNLDVPLSPEHSSGRSWNGLLERMRKREQ